MNLREASALDALHWVVKAFPDTAYAKGHNSPDPSWVLPFIEHGLVETEFIEANAREHWIVATLPAGVEITEAEYRDFLYVGGPCWVGDPENREEWVEVGRRADKHNLMMGRSSRYGPDGEHRNDLHPHEIVTTLYAADRGPSYARQMVDLATRHKAEIDAFGFSDEVTPAAYNDLLTSGIRNRTDLAGYRAVGLTFAEAIAFRHDDIPPAAVLMAKKEKRPRSTWREVLAPLPSDWFRDIGRRMWSDDDAFDGKGELAYHLSSGGNDRYTLDDLLYLAAHGWTGDHWLRPTGVRGLGMDEVAETARSLADHGITWNSLEGWTKALVQGKAPDPRWGGNTLPPLLGHWGTRNGRGEISVSELRHVFALADLGLKPSHIGAFRKAGCRTVDDIVEAAEAGVTAKIAEELTERYAPTPKARHYSKRLPAGTLLQTYRKHLQEAS